MSRSYKHTHMVGQRVDKFNKKYSNKIVRRKHINDGLSKKALYKKYYNSWNIRDWKFLCLTFENYLYEYKIRKINLPEKELRKTYKKTYVRKQVNGDVAQLAEAIGLSPMQYGFESLRRYQVIKYGQYD